MYATFSDANTILGEGLPKLHKKGIERGSTSLFVEEDEWRDNETITDVITRDIRTVL